MGWRAVQKDGRRDLSWDIRMASRRGAHEVGCSALWMDAVMVCERVAMMALKMEALMVGGWAGTMAAGMVETTVTPKVAEWDR